MIDPVIRVVTTPSDGNGAISDTHRTGPDWYGGRTVGYRVADGARAWRDHLSYPPPPPDPQQPYDPSRPYPPTAAFAPYDPGHVGPGAPVPPPPRRSNLPLIAVILAITMLLCGGTIFAGVLVVRNVVQTAKEAVPDLPVLPTEVPALPTELPGLPTELPDLPSLPTDLPTLPDGGNESGKTVTVQYLVDGDGPADITYLEKPGKTPKTVRNAKLPWRLTVSMSGISLVSVIAVRADAATGSISCRATVDGTQVAERTRTGSYAVATCTKLIIE